MAIKKTFSPASRKPVGRRPVTASRTMNRTASTVGRRPVNASTSITAGVKSRQATRPMTNSKLNANMAKLTPTQRIFANQLLEENYLFNLCCLRFLVESECARTSVCFY